MPHPQVFSLAGGQLQDPAGGILAPGLQDAFPVLLLPVDGPVQVDVGEAPVAAVGGDPGLPIPAKIGLLPLPGIQVHGKEVHVPAVLPVLVLPPFVPVEGAEGLRQMGIIVVAHQGQPVPFGGQPGHGGIVAVRHAADLPGGDAQELRQEQTDGAAVGDHGHLAPGMLFRDGQKGGFHPPHGLLSRFGAGDGPGPGVPVQPVVFLRRKAFHPAPALVLPVPHVHFPQVLPDAQEHPPGLGQGPGGIHGPAQIAGIHRVQPGIPEALRQIGELPEAHLRQGAVVPAMDAAVQIALRLPVADEPDAGHDASRVIFRMLPMISNSRPLR